MLIYYRKENELKEPTIILGRFLLIRKTNCYSGPLLSFLAYNLYPLKLSKWSAVNKTNTKTHNYNNNQDWHPIIPFVWLRGRRRVSAYRGFRRVIIMWSHSLFRRVFPWEQLPPSMGIPAGHVPSRMASRLRRIWSCPNILAISKHGNWSIRQSNLFARPTGIIHGLTNGTYMGSSFWFRST